MEIFGSVSVLASAATFQSSRGANSVFRNNLSRLAQVHDVRITGREGHDNVPLIVTRITRRYTNSSREIAS